MERDLQQSRDIHHLLELSSIKISYLQMLGEKDRLKCFFSSSKSLQTGMTYSLFEIPSLSRVLAQKNGIISKEIRTSLALRSSAQICFILEWSVFIKRVVIFDLENAGPNAIGNLEKVLEQKDTIRNDFFNKLHSR